MPVPGNNLRIRHWPGHAAATRELNALGWAGWAVETLGLLYTVLLKVKN